MPKPIIPKNVPWEESKRLKTILNLPNFMFSFHKFFKFLLITTKNVPLTSNSNVYTGEEVFFFSFTSIIFSSLTKWNIFMFACKKSCSNGKKKQNQSPRGVVKKVLLEISQNSQENNYARASFLIKPQPVAFFPSN